MSAGPTCPSTTPTHKSDFEFPAHPLGQRSAAGPQNQFVPSEDDRDFSTEGRTEFVPKRLEACPAIPVAAPSKSVPGHVLVEKVPGSELSGATTYRRKQMW